MLPLVTVSTSPLVLLSVASVGILVIFSDRLESASISALRAGAIDRLIAVASVPLASETTRLGASAAGVTVTMMLWLVGVEAVPSVLVAVTVSVKFGSSA